MTKFNATTKLKAIKLYQKGMNLTKISEALKIANTSEIRNWLDHYHQEGLGGIQNKQTKIKYGGEFKLQALNWRKQHNTSYRITALHFKITHSGTIANWQKKFDTGGVAALFVKQGRPTMHQAKEPKKKPVNDSELSELKQLKLTNRALRVENEYLKKLTALVQKRGHLPKKGKSSKN